MGGSLEGDIVANCFKGWTLPIDSSADTCLYVSLITPGCLWWLTSHWRSFGRAARNLSLHNGFLCMQAALNVQSTDYVKHLLCWEEVGGSLEGEPRPSLDEVNCLQGYSWTLPIDFSINTCTTCVHQPQMFHYDLRCMKNSCNPSLPGELTEGVSNAWPVLLKCFPLYKVFDWSSPNHGIESRFNPTVQKHFNSWDTTR